MITPGGSIYSDLSREGRTGGGIKTAREIVRRKTGDLNRRERKRDESG